MSAATTYVVVGSVQPDGRLIGYVKTANGPEKPFVVVSGESMLRVRHQDLLPLVGKGAVRLDSLPRVEPDEPPSPRAVAARERHAEVRTANCLNAQELARLVGLKPAARGDYSCPWCSGTLEAFDTGGFRCYGRCLYNRSNTQFFARLWRCPQTDAADVLQRLVRGR